MLNFVQYHRVKAPTGALDPCSWQLPRFITIGTGYYHQPVPISPPSFGTGWWFKPVPMLTHWNRLEPPPGANCPPLGWSKAKGTSCCCSRYRWAIGTGCNSSWYLWPGSMARFLVVRCRSDGHDTRHYRKMTPIVIGLFLHSAGQHDQHDMRSHATSHHELVLGGDQLLLH